MKSVLTATVTVLGLIFTTLGTGILAGRAEAMPTFAKEVAPILFNNCVSCHRPGDIAPMSFLSYCGRGTTLFHPVFRSPVRRRHLRRSDRERCLQTAPSSITLAQT